MEDIKKAQKRLVAAIVAMHPELWMGDKKQEELYLAMHDLTSKMSKLSKCGGECSNENSVLHIFSVSDRTSPNNRLKIEPVFDGISTAVTQYKVTDDLGSLWITGTREECQAYLYGR